MGSASGKKTMVFNPRERALSTDLNRLQSFGGFDVATMLAFLFDYTGADAVTSGGAGNVGGATTAPLRAQILSGLRVAPQMGSANTLVDAGVLVCCNPDGAPNADDSPYKFVNDVGVTNGATLPLVSNASGSTQIHIVECSRVDVVDETDNRDIFDPATGLFAPALVNKVVRSKLTYRIRAGTLAAGVTVSSGWLPLAVALVPNGATTWNDVLYIWDVRPLVSDRAQTPFGNFTTTASPVLLQEVELVPATQHLRGRVSTIGATGRKLGGDLAYSPADTFLDLASVELMPTVYTRPANTAYYLWLCEPFGLPRWCRYTSVASGTRTPGRLRGMPVLSSVASGTNAPQPVSNQNSSTLPLPDTFGFPAAAAANTAVCVWSGMVDGAGAAITHGFTNGDKTFFQTCETDVFTPASSSTTIATWNIAIGNIVPGNARELLFSVVIAYNANAGTTTPIDYRVAFDDGAGSTLGVAARGQVSAVVGIPYEFTVTFRVPVPSQYPAGTLPTIKIIVTHNGATAGYAVAPDSAALTLVGWQIN